jgi:glycerate-2-kinase
MNPTISQAKNQIQTIFNAGVLAADPARAVRQALHIKSDKLYLASDHETGHRSQRSEPWSAVHIIAFGKAACAMASVAVEIISPSLMSSTGIIVTNYENQKNVDGFNVFGAGHPLPDSQGVFAAQHIAVRAQQAQLGELVLVLVSGGGSALIPYPPESVSLQDKINTTQMLLGSGANINEINCVRKHISQLKGGKLAQLTCPADLHALILSDVIGDDLSSIASGPTIADSTSFNDAIKILNSRKLWKQIPDSVRLYLLAGYNGDIAENPKPDNPVFKNTGQALIGSNSICVDAMAKAAQQAGFSTEIYSKILCGEAREEAGKLCDIAARKLTEITKPTALLAGGETTVTVTGSGLGGRNQEFALAFALTAQQINLPPRWVFLSAGTDGRDGPTDAAGAIVDSKTISRIITDGGNPLNYLDNNDSYHALKLAHDLLITGPTGTNVADLEVLLLFPE